MTTAARALILIAFVAPAAAFAHERARAQSQSHAPQSGSAKAAGPARARKVDEFGRLHGCDGGARLDNFAIELENEPGSKAYIVARDARGKLPGAAHAWGEYFLQYFVDMRGIDGSRFTLVDGAGVAGDDLKMELWLVPPGAEPPRVRPLGKEDARPFAGKFAELSVFSDTAFYDTDGSEAGSFHTGILYAAYENLLKKQADSQGYLVVYSPPGAAPGYWRRAGTRERQKISGADLAPERVTVINGGALPVEAKPPAGEEQEETYGKVEFWVGAKDAPPVRHVEDDAKLTGALLVGDSDTDFGVKETAAWLLDNLAEMMRADGRSVGCIVVYPGDGSTVPTGEGGAEALPPDAFKMAQGWKAELLKKHGFAPERVVILSGPAEDSGAGRIQVWAVPQGAPLPDPFAEAKGEAGAEEGGDEKGGGEEKPSPPPVRTEGVNLKWQ